MPRCSACRCRGSPRARPRRCAWSIWTRAGRWAVWLRVARRELLLRRAHAARAGARDRGRRRDRLPGAGVRPEPRVSAAAYVLLEDGARFDGEACAADGPAVGEVVFTTGMSGYQECITDPSFHAQLLTFTAPMVGNYGASAAAMESDRAHARGAIMREAVNASEASGAEQGWLDWLRARAACRGSPALTRARSCATCARRARCRGKLPGRHGRGRGARADRRRAVHDRPRPRARGHRVRAGRARGRRQRAAPGRAGHRHQGVDRAQLHLPRGDARAAALHHTGGGGARARRRRHLPRARARRPGGPGPLVQTVRNSSAGRRSSASASATNCSPGPFGGRRSTSPSATAAATIRSRTCGRGGFPSPRRTTASRCAASLVSGSRATSARACSRT